MEGWVCSRCGNSNSPLLLVCGCSSTAAASGATDRSTAAAPTAASPLPEGLDLGSKAVKPSPKKRFQYNDPDFNAFWQEYPKKRGKEDAWIAWQGVIASGVPAAAVLAAAVRYRNDPSRDPAKTKYPQGWLRGGRFLDEPDEVSHPAAAVREIDFEAEQQRRWSEEDEALAKTFAENAGGAAMAFLNGSDDE